MDSKENKNSRSEKLINLALDGHLGAQFEVSDWYKNGRFSLDKDVDKSNEYLESVYKALKTAKPHIKNIKVINYKGIKSITGNLELHPNINVFVGINGSGKTTLLDIIVKSLSWLATGIKTGGNGRHIDKKEINSHPASEDCFLITSLSLDEKTSFEQTLYKSKRPSKIVSELVEFRNLSDMLVAYNHHLKSACLPLFSHYSVNRASEFLVIEEPKKKNNKITTKLDAYEHTFDENKKYKELVEWLSEKNRLNAKSRELENEYIKVLAECKYLEKMYSSLPKEVLELDFGISMTKDLEDKKNKVIELELLKVDNDDLVVKVVKEAIYKFMNISNIRMDLSDDTISILMEKNNVTISAFDLSQGEKAIFLLVSDISRRLVLLNPEIGEEALKGSGIVTIDEIELHLHPSWQQNIVIKLTEVFPNIQFIFTTHSPQVLSTVPNYCIKVLKNEDGNVEVTQPEFSLGSESNAILEDIFLVDSRPETVEQVKQLNRFQELIKEDKWDSDEALSLERKLVNWAGEHDPIIKKLQMDIRLRKRRGSK